MSQSTLISIVLIVLIIAIFLYDFLKNKKNNQIDRSVKHFVEEKGNKINWIKTNKLFWLLPVFFFITVFVSLFDIYISEPTFRQYLSLDFTKEITISEFDIIHNKHLNDELTIESIEYLNDNNNRIYFIQTSNIRKSDWNYLEGLRFKQQQKYDSLEIVFQNHEQKNLYKIITTDSYDLVGKNIFSSYWKKIEQLCSEDHDLKYRIRKLVPIGNVHPVDLLQVLSNGIDLSAYLKLKISYENNKRAKRENVGIITKTSYLDGLTFDDQPGYLIYNEASEAVPYQFTRERIKFKYYNFLHKFIISPPLILRYGDQLQNELLFLFIIYFYIFSIIRFIFYVGGKSWFFNRKKNVVMFLLLVFIFKVFPIQFFMKKTDYYALDFDLLFSDHLIFFIFSFTLLSIFVWFFNDKIKVQ